MDTARTQAGPWPRPAPPAAPTPAVLLSSLHRERLQYTAPRQFRQQHTCTVYLTLGASGAMRNPYHVTEANALPATELQVAGLADLYRDAKNYVAKQKSQIPEEFEKQLGVMWVPGTDRTKPTTVAMGLIKRDKAGGHVDYWRMTIECLTGSTGIQDEYDNYKLYTKNPELWKKQDDQEKADLKEKRRGYIHLLKGKTKVAPKPVPPPPPPKKGKALPAKVEDPDGGEWAP